MPVLALARRRAVHRTSTGAACAAPTQSRRSSRPGKGGGGGPCRDAATRGTAPAPTRDSGKGQPMALVGVAGASGAHAAGPAGAATPAAVTSAGGGSGSGGADATAPNNSCKWSRSSVKPAASGARDQPSSRSGETVTAQGTSLLFGFAVPSSRAPLSGRASRSATPVKLLGRAWPSTSAITSGACVMSVCGAPLASVTSMDSWQTPALPGARVMGNAVRASS
mmetsp:Transcript_74606/g.205692  ORF Transcript_74606/g.205692 Transcript_74606/m.205692 type:complete len:223 (-) Transcript_74606:1656-2324(-)